MTSDCVMPNSLASDAKLAHQEANEYVPVLLGDLRRNVRCIRHATFTFDTPPTEAEITKAEVSPVVVEMFARVKAAEPVGHTAG